MDVFLFFFLQFIFYTIDSSLKCFFFNFVFVLRGVFRYTLSISIRFFISFFTFVFLLIRCFGGYFVYSFCPCGILEFTFVYSSVAWLRVLFSFISREKFSVYISKSGDRYIKTLTIFFVEIISEFSRPVALTVRLTVNIIVGHLIRVVIYRVLELNLSIMYSWLPLLAIIMECFVFFIQSYIFSRLIFLYLGE